MEKMMPRIRIGVEAISGKTVVFPQVHLCISFRQLFWRLIMFAELQFIYAWLILCIRFSLLSKQQQLAECLVTIVCTGIYLYGSATVANWV